MLTSIELENFRGFKHYALKGLSRVNLLVGDNGSGKTSVLESLYIFASGGSPSALSFLASARGEFVLTSMGTGSGSDLPRPGNRAPVLSHFFHGHEAKPGAFFRIKANAGNGPLTVLVEEASPAQVLAHWTPFEPLPDRALFLLRSEGGPRQEDQSRQEALIADSGELWRAASSLLGSRPSPSWETPRDIQFISPGSRGPTPVHEMWARVVTEGTESGVVQAMKIVRPDLKDIISLGYASGVHSGRTDGFLVGLEGQQGRLPLGTLGDGATRLFAIATALVHGARGTLLFDEIDTGLHYSIMGDLWRLIVETCKRSETQVFATTHSLDCIRGLAWLCGNYPELGQEVSVQKIHPALQQAVSLQAENILIATEQEIEVR